jgi:hypothetical protein
MIVAVTLGCTGAALLPLQFAWNTHALAYTSVCLLGAFVVWLTLRFERAGTSQTATVAFLAVASIVFGTAAASDPLTLIAGLAPFALTGMVLAGLSPRDFGRRLLGSVAAVTAASLVIELIVNRAMRSHHLIAALFPVTLAPFDRLAHNAGLLVHSLTVLWNGDFGGAAISPSALLALICAVAVVAGGIAALRSGRSAVTQIAHGFRRAARERRPARDLARVAHLTYWLASGLAMSASFVFTSAAVALPDKRYLPTVGYAIAAIVAVEAARKQWTRAVVTAAACAIVAASASAILHSDIQSGDAAGFPKGLGPALVTWAHNAHVSVGYASYWDAAPLTWQAGGRVDVYPVQACVNDPRVCPAGRPRISTWYTPRDHVRSFLIVDSQLIKHDRDLGITAPPPSLGRPVQVGHINQLTLYVYPYDIASRFGTPPG